MNFYNKNRIVTNKLLYPTKRFISNYNREFIGSDGPNCSIKLSLEDIGIPYDQQYHSRVILPSNTENYYLNFGTLTDTTFVLIKVTYNGNYEYENAHGYDSFDPYYNYNYQQVRKEENSYNIFYYFEDNSGTTYPINRLLLLNGSFNNKLPKIYLNNPLDYDVELEILHGNILPPKYIPPITGVTKFTNLYYSDIITDQILCGESLEYVGSSKFIISGYLSNGYLGTFNLPFDSFNENHDSITIEKDVSKLTISIYTYWDIVSETITTSLNTVMLKFLTEFDFYQAYSRMMFALTSYINYEENICRYLTTNNVYDSDSPIICSNSGLTGTDILPPVIYYNSSEYWNGSGTTIPSNVVLPLKHNISGGDPCIGNVIGWTLDELKELFIDSIIDCWDGDITNNVELYLTKSGSSILLDAITEDGAYNITIRITDNANNTTIHKFIKK